MVKITDPLSQQDEIINAGQILRRGEPVAFPTETVYGLGANAFDAVACAKIYLAKGRPADNPLIIHVSERAMIEQAVGSVNEAAEKLITAFCPGPLTVILPKNKRIPDSVTGHLPTVGIRWPDNAVARAVIKAAGVPIAAPSANLSGRPSPTSAQMVADDLNGRIPLIIDGGDALVGLESTIVDCTEVIPTILRPGAVTREMLAEVLGEVRLDAGLITAAQPPKAPGMKYRHYAPRSPLTLIEGLPDAMPQLFRSQVREQMALGKNVGVLASHEVITTLSGLLPGELMFDYGSQKSPASVAANLYAGLSHFDHTEANCIFAEGVRETGLGLAIMNRLRKAAGGRILKADDVDL